MEEQGINPEALFHAVSSYIDSIPQLRVDASVNKEDVLTREVLRGALMPVATYLIERGHQFPPGEHTPEMLIREAAKRQELVEENDRKVLGTNYGEQTNQQSSPRDWRREAIQMSIDMGHPINKLSRAAVSKVSPNARAALTKAAFSK